MSRGGGMELDYIATLKVHVFKNGFLIDCDAVQNASIHPLNQRVVLHREGPRVTADAFLAAITEEAQGIAEANEKEPEDA